MAKVAFGVALPVIFISGSINTTVVGRYLHGRMFRNSIKRYINTVGGWSSWLILITVITIVAFLIAEAIPFFSELLSISSSLFISGFTFYFPALMWFMLLRDGKWTSKENLPHALGNALAFIIGAIVLVCGTYASIEEIVSTSPPMSAISIANPSLENQVRDRRHQPSFHLPASGLNMYHHHTASFSAFQFQATAMIYDLGVSGGAAGPLTCWTACFCCDIKW
jgi:hypothetical protein